MNKLAAFSKKRRAVRRLRIAAGALAAVLFLAGCGAQTSSGNESAGALGEASDAETAGSGDVLSASGDLFAMDTYMTVTCYGERCEEALEASLKEIERLDSLLSVGNSDSEVSRLRDVGEGTLSPDTEAIVREALDVCEMTGGAFDITVAPLMDLWGFTTGEFRVPDEAEIAEALETVGSNQLTLEEAASGAAGTESTGPAGSDGVEPAGDEGGPAYHLTLGPGQAIDLGGIAKGYTSDRLMQIFKDYGLTAGLVSLGGNVQCYGVKPDGTLWRCGIRDPLKSRDPSAFLGVVETADRAVITSGGYERFFEDKETGQTYHHILDPKTGYPADSGLLSVTVVSGSGILADALTTALYVMGLEEAEALWRENRESFDMILMTEDKEVYVTAGIAEAFSSDYPIHILKSS